LSYIAIRKAQLADASARAALALKEKEAAEREAQNVQAAQLADARNQLSTAKSNLEKTQDQPRSWCARCTSSPAEEIMRNALALAGVVLAVGAACAQSSTRMQPEPGRGYTLQTTGAAIGRDDVTRNEPDPTLGEVAMRLASQICEREARCHGSAVVPLEQCMRVFTRLTAVEVVSWSCSPAATRSRAKECTASLNAEPCELDISTKPGLCPPSDACPDTTAKLASPGAEVAKARRSPGYGARPAFDYEAAVTVLGAIDLKPCLDAEGPSGTAHIIVTFAPDGGVLTSSLDHGPDGSAVDLDGTPRGQCVVEKFRKARVPTFDGDPQDVGVSIPFE